MSRCDFSELARQDLRDIFAYIVFYRIIEDGVEIASVIHGARDIDRLV